MEETVQFLLIKGTENRGNKIPGHRYFRIKLVVDIDFKTVFCGKVVRLFSG